MRLSLTGSLSEELGFERKTGKYPLIHGIVNDSPCGRAFTLVDCFRTKRTVRMPGFATEEIRANQAYAGSAFLSEDDLLFDSASLELSALDSWIRTTGLSINSATEAQGSQVQYFRPDSVSFGLDAQTLKIDFWPFVSVSFRSYHLDEKVGVVIDNLGGVSSKEVFQQYIYPLQNFFTFATDHPNELDSVVFYNSGLKSAETERRSPIHFLAQPIYLVEEPKKTLAANDMLYTYEDVKGYLPSVFRKWFEFAQEFKPFCQSFFGLIYAPGSFVDRRFVSLIEAMILFFRGLGIHDPSLPPALDEAARTIQARYWKGKNLRWLADVMPTVADVSLPWTLASTLDDHRDLMAPLIGNDVEQFVDHVLITRKYCQYRDSALQANVAHGAELYWLTEKLKVLVKILILERLGIPWDLVTRLIKRNRVYTHLVALGESAD